ncbi:Smok, partial [Symbiodinium natans]
MTSRPQPRRRVVIKRKVSSSTFERHKAKMENLGLDPSDPLPPQSEQLLDMAEAKERKTVSLKTRTLEEQIVAKRYDRALERFAQQQEEWEKFRHHASRKTGRDKEELVVTRAEEYRERLEVMELLDRATPDEIKSGGFNWYHSLRGDGTRFIRVGNMFSGLYLPLKLHKENFVHEIIRKPLLVDLTTARHTAEASGRKKPRSWRDDEYLLTRIRKYGAKMKELAPGQLEYDEVMEPEYGTVWAVRRHCQGLAEEELMAALLEEGSTDNTMPLEQEPLASAACAAPIEGPHAEVAPAQLHFQADVKTACTRTIRLRNTGSAAIQFEWVQNAPRQGFQESMLPQDPTQHFTCHQTSGRVLPGEDVQTMFSFTSSAPGTFQSSWCLQTYPQLSEPITELAMNGSATAGDAHWERRAALQAHMVKEQTISLASELAEDIVASAVTDVRLFEEVNGADGLFWSPQSQWILAGGMDDTGKDADQEHFLSNESSRLTLLLMAAAVLFFRLPDIVRQSPQAPYQRFEHLIMDVQRTSCNSAKQYREELQLKQRSRAQRQGMQGVQVSTMRFPCSAARGCDALGKAPPNAASSLHRGLAASGKESTAVAMNDGSRQHLSGRRMVKLCAKSGKFTVPRTEKSELQFELDRASRWARRQPLERSPLWWLAYETILEVASVLPGKWAATRQRNGLEPLPFLTPPDDDAAPEVVEEYNQKLEERKAKLAPEEKEAEVREIFCRGFIKNKFGPACERFEVVAKEATVTARISRAGGLSLADRLRPYLGQTSAEAPEGDELEEGEEPPAEAQDLGDGIFVSRAASSSGLGSQALVFSIAYMDSDIGRVYMRFYPAIESELSDFVEIMLHAQMGCFMPIGHGMSPLAAVWNMRQLPIRASIAEEAAREAAQAELGKPAVDEDGKETIPAPLLIILGGGFSAEAQEEVLLKKLELLIGLSRFAEYEKGGVHVFAGGALATYILSGVLGMAMGPSSVHDGAIKASLKEAKDGEEPSDPQDSGAGLAAPLAVSSRRTLFAVCDAVKSSLDTEAAWYVVHESLGQGSMGTVYRGTRRTDQREVALKAMQALDEEMTALFKQEFTILRRLKHPHIIEALDFFVAEDQAVLVLELFEGVALTSAAKWTPFGLPESVGQRLFKQLMLATDYLHHRQIIHRDIKGENVLVSQNLMDLRLIDFNSARCLLEGGSLTNAGTQEYASPEVCRGEPHSASSDIWCAGLCLYLMLAGHLPRRGHQYKSFEAFKQAVSREPIVAKGRIENCSEACRELLLLCLKLDTAQRPSAEVLLGYEWLRGGKRHTIQPRLPVVSEDGGKEEGPTSPISRECYVSVDTQHGILHLQKCELRTRQSSSAWCSCGGPMCRGTLTKLSDAAPDARDDEAVPTEADGDAVATSASGIPEAWTVRDIGPAALEQLRTLLRRSRGAIWNGALGCHEDARWQKGTQELINLLEGRLTGAGEADEDEEDEEDEEEEEDEGDDEDVEAKPRKEPKLPKERPAEFEVAAVLGRDSCRLLAEMAENPAHASFVSNTGEGLLHLLRGSPL